MNEGAIVSTAMNAVKVLVIIGLILYTGFASIVVRQEHLMSNVLEEHSEYILRILVKLHLAASIGTIILAIILL